MKPKQITDVNMLKAMAYIADAHQLIQSEICKEIGFISNNLSNIKKGKQSFSTEHILQICRKYDINPNFIFGFSKNILRDKTSHNPISIIRAALKEIEISNKLK